MIINLIELHQKGKNIPDDVTVIDYKTSLAGKIILNSQIINPYNNGRKNRSPYCSTACKLARGNSAGNGTRHGYLYSRQQTRTTRCL